MQFDFSGTFAKRRSEFTSSFTDKLSWKRLLQSVNFRLLEVSETDSGTILRSKRALQRVMTTSCFAALVGKTNAHCLVRSPASMSAASTVLWKIRKNL